MKVTMLLADHAVVENGKLYINGGGWTITGPDPFPYAIALIIEVPWDRANIKHHFRLELLDEDGESVEVPTTSGADALVVEGDFEVTRPLGAKPGTPLPLPIAVNLTPAPPIPAGARYAWNLSINGETREDWRLSFATRPQEPGSTAA